MSTTTSDVIDSLVGTQPGSRLDALRAQRPQARENAQKSYVALFEPEVPGNVSSLERYAIGTFVAGLHGQQVAIDYYSSQLLRLGTREISDAIEAEIACGLVRGPYGCYPQGPLSKEDETGLDFRVLAGHEQVLGPRLSAALQHAHLLVFHPRDASAAALQHLLDAGWSTTDIVTLAQLVSFLSFQIRLVIGLHALMAVASQGPLEADDLPTRGAVLASGSV
jgi:CMD domain protein